MLARSAKPTTSERNNHLSPSSQNAQNALLERTSTHSGSSEYQTPNDPSDDDSDDVPLAQRIPTALAAQKSIKLKDSSRRRQNRPGPGSLNTSVPRQGKKRSNPPSPGLPTEELMRRLMELKTQEVGTDQSAPDTGARSQVGSAWTSVVMPKGNAQTHPPDSSRQRVSTRALTTAAHVDAVSAHSDGQRVVSRGDSARVRPMARLPRPVRRDTEPGRLVHPHTSPTLTSHSTHDATVPDSSSLPLQTLQEHGTTTEPAPLDILFTVTVYVFDIQRVITMDVCATTTARSVLDAISKRGGFLSDVSRLNELAVWELANDFGMERPLREFELLRRVCESWDLQKPVNAFMVRYSPLSRWLSARASPAIQPLAQGEVQWQVKRGKWSKRHLSLQEGSVYIGKTGKGKDEHFLCSLSNHDFYKLTRVHKAPKPFVFAIKSTDNIAFFENPAESVLIFAVGAEEGERWREQILLARSFILLREQAVQTTVPVRPSAPQPAQPMIQLSKQVFRKGTLLGNIEGSRTH